ncbi:DUF58 domain-containing protein [Actinopolymorpha singaporensis]
MRTRLTDRLPGHVRNRLRPAGGGASPGWSPTPALRRALVVTLALLVAAVLTGRVDLVVLATPFAVGTSAALLRRPRGLPTVRVGAAEGQDPAGGSNPGGANDLVEGSDLHVLVDVRAADASYDVALVQREQPPWLRDRTRARTLAAAVPADAGTRFTLTGQLARWGRYVVPPVRVRAAACDALLTCAPVTSDSVAVRVFPRTEPFAADEAMPNAAGLVGVHRSRRFGEGGELAGIRHFAPGDRLRRIDWRASLRTGELHVAQTLSDRDAELVLVLDVLHEAGRSEGIDGAPSVLDTTVRAAAGIAQHYLGRGDRVRLLEYGGRNRALRVGSGRRHFVAALEWLLAIRAGEGPHDPAAGIFARQILPQQALLVVLTPLLDRRSVALLARLARSGRTVLAVDTLPDSARPDRENPWTPVAFGLWRLERRNTVAQLLEHGVPTVTWAGAGSLDQALRDVSRRAAAPR